MTLVLGQINYFMEFDVCFYRSRKEFELHRAGQRASPSE